MRFASRGAAAFLPTRKKLINLNIEPHCINWSIAGSLLPAACTFLTCPVCLSKLPRTIPVAHTSLMKVSLWSEDCSCAPHTSSSDQCNQTGYRHFTRTMTRLQFSWLRRALFNPEPVTYRLVAAQNNAHRKHEKAFVSSFATLKSKKPLCWVFWQAWSSGPSARRQPLDVQEVVCHDKGSFCPCFFFAETRSLLVRFSKREKTSCCSPELKKRSLRMDKTGTQAASRWGEEAPQLSCAGARNTCVRRIRAPLMHGVANGASNHPALMGQVPAHPGGLPR